MTMITRWSPVFSGGRDLTTLRDEVDQVFESLFSRPSRRLAASAYFPPADIHETAEEFVVRLDLPGVSQKDVRVTLMGDTLTIRGERKLEEQGETGTLHYRERIAGTYERTFQLTSPVRGDQVKATYRDGVLEVRVPKAEEARTREIEVRVG